MIKNLESLILILHQESALFIMECVLFTVNVLDVQRLGLFYVILIKKNGVF